MVQIDTIFRDRLPGLPYVSSTSSNSIWRTTCFFSSLASNSTNARPSAECPRKRVLIIRYLCQPVPLRPRLAVLPVFSTTCSHLGAACDRLVVVGGWPYASPDKYTPTQNPRRNHRLASNRFSRTNTRSRAEGVRPGTVGPGYANGHYRSHLETDRRATSPARGAPGRPAKSVVAPG